MSFLVNLEDLGLDQGGHILIDHALRQLPDDGEAQIQGSDTNLVTHLRAWCRAKGHHFDEDSANNGALRVRKGASLSGRWCNAERAGNANVVVENPSPRWGLAARGAMVEAGGPEFDFSLDNKLEIWADNAHTLYLQAIAAQWDPETAIDWSQSTDLPDEVEDAIVQVMTYLIENEVAALVVPARFVAQVHPHFKEVMQLLAVQAADEARHIEVFTRRARLNRDELGLSTVGGQASLKTLVDESDFALASFLLSVLGEGTFLALLRFLEVHAPDPVTRQIMRLAAIDEARHVAFGVSHLKRHVEKDPGELKRLSQAVHRRHAELLNTAGLNEEVFDSLVLLAAGSFEPQAIAKGYELIAELQSKMDEGRRMRLTTIGFSNEAASALSKLHTRNFM